MSNYIVHTYYVINDDYDDDLISTVYRISRLQIANIIIIIIIIIIIVLVQRFNAILLHDSLPTTDGAD